MVDSNICIVCAQNYLIMKRTIILMMATLALVTCKKQTVTGPEGPQGPQGAQGPAGTTANGSIFGKVTLVDPNASTATLSLANTTVSIANQTVQAQTDAKGSYTLTDVKPGMTDILVTATDGSVYKWQQFSYPGNNAALANFTVSKKLTENVTGKLVDTTVIGKKGIFVRAVFNPTITNSRAMVVLIGSSNGVSPNDISTYNYSTVMLGSGANLKINMFIDYDYIKSPYTFAEGQQVFVKAYPMPASNYSYYDVYAGDEVYYTAGAPIAATFSTTVQ